MGRVIAGMVMSLDGFVADRDGSLALLYPDFEALAESDAVQDAIQTTGAVVMGRRSYDMSNGDFTGYELQAPIFVLTHSEPAEPALGQNDRLSVTFVTSTIEETIALAKQAAGELDVTVVGGPETIGQCLTAGLIDELHMDIRAVLLGDGLPMFGQTGRPPVELEIVELTQSPGYTHLRYRIVRS
ncbi:MAG: dihydrofolate reductase family protein [Thermomicrobiales bacterium]|nr:dihydrofolate reductase family protein [Thermomicrobiales bacterium]